MSQENNEETPQRSGLGMVWTIDCTTGDEPKAKLRGEIGATDLARSLGWTVVDMDEDDE